MLLNFPAIWKAAFQAHIEIITINPEQENKITSLYEGIIGSKIKKIHEKIVKGKY